ncbi:Calcium and integrin-binding protein 1 [Stylophora pistillata]|uniref:Calcium and integrin-binding protein 1 n=1 Tax=Stylophora pistillata TaxID=50429 RepID=A0A2B4SSH4_STYPI|nr:Calcium and integrin-binding protein 1 [Stylophora pistillata]
MGGQHSQFTEEELKDYQELTYFTQKEILHCHKRFSQLDPDTVRTDKNAKLSSRKIMTLPELRVNPFKDRICRVFSSSKDGELTFEDFLDMMSVFSENAPKSVKVEYAFRIYDFNEDDYICEGDLKKVIQRLCGDQKLSNENVNALIQKIDIVKLLEIARQAKQLAMALLNTKGGKVSEGFLKERFFKAIVSSIKKEAEL